MSDDRRTVSPSRQRFVRNADVSADSVTRLEGERGGSAAGSLAIKALIAGREMLLMEVHRKKGRVDPTHAHPDHESICYLVSGRMRVVIEGQSFIAEPGDAWIHAPGVTHYHETLEDAVQIEIKSPPRKPWA